MVVMTEEWSPIPDFSRYEISNLGRVMDLHNNTLRSTSENNYGNIRISLFADDGIRHTRSVAQMVAEAFVEPPNARCDHVVVLDGRLDNVRSENLVWRPRWFAWKYTHQLKIVQPVHYHNLPIYNVAHRVRYNSIIEAGISEGLLFDDIWRSTYTGSKCFPTGSTFEVSRRV